ncbi:MAG: ATP-binding protein [Anaerolineae bacterium]
MRELSLHLLDLLENSREAGADTICVSVCEDGERDELTMAVVDNGRGIPADILPTVFDPFYTTRSTRAVGLGLPLLKAAAERAGGDATISSRPGHTEVRARFIRSHIDRAPLGDVPGSLIALLTDARSPRVCYHHEVDGRSFDFDTAEIVAVLDGMPLADARVQRWLHSHLEQGIAEVQRNEAD